MREMRRVSVPASALALCRRLGRVLRLLADGKYLEKENDVVAGVCFVVGYDVACRAVLNRYRLFLSLFPKQYSITTSHVAFTLYEA